MGRFEDSRPGSSVASSNVSSAAPSTTGTPNMSDAEGSKDDMKFRAKKKKKMTRTQQKEREVRRRLRYIEWLNSPKVRCLHFTHSFGQTLTWF
jgi:elongation factor 3